MDGSNFREIMGFSVTKMDEVDYEDDDADESIPSVQKITKKNNILQLWGNQTTMNMNNLVLENIVQSTYYKNYLIEVTTFQQAMEEIGYITHLEPWERGTRKAPGTGMCGGVRGVSSGGVISTAFCILYKMFTLRLTRKQLVSMINHTQSVYARGIGFLYIRFCQPPTDLLKWFEPYIDDEEEIDPRAGGGDKMTIGQMLKQMLTKLDWYSTLFPRLPFNVQKEIESKYGDKSRRRSPERKRERSPERRRERSPARSSDQHGSSSTHRRKRCGHHLRHHHCRKHRTRCPTKAKKRKTESNEKTGEDKSVE